MGVCRITILELLGRVILNHRVCINGVIAYLRALDLEAVLITLRIINLHKSTSPTVAVSHDRILAVFFDDPSVLIQSSASMIGAEHASDL